MINKTEILKMARSILKGDSGRVQHPVVEPRREWFIGIGLFLIVLIAGGAYTAKKYQYYGNIESTIETSTKTHKKFDQNSAESALSLFQKRQEKFNVVVDTPVEIEYLEQASSTTTGTSTAASVDAIEEEKEPVANSATSSDSIEE